MSKEMIGSIDIDTLISLAKHNPRSALIIAHGEGLLEGIVRYKNKDIDIVIKKGESLMYAANYLNNKTLKVVPIINGTPVHSNVFKSVAVSGKEEARKLCKENGWKPWNF
jgi:hypothetical protein